MWCRRGNSPTAVAFDRGRTRKCAQYSLVASPGTRWSQKGSAPKRQAGLRSCAANGCRDQSSLPMLSVRARRCAANLSLKLERSRASPCAKLATHGRCSCGFLEPITHVLAVSFPRMLLLLATVYSTQRHATENRTRGLCDRLDPFGNRHEKSGAGFSGWFTVWKMAQKPVWQCLRCMRNLPAHTKYV